MPLPHSNVIIETKSENVSCFLWPSFDNSSTQYSTNNNVYFSQ